MWFGRSITRSFRPFEVGARYRELNQRNQQLRFRNDAGVDLSPLDNSFFGPSFFSEGKGFFAGQIENQGLLVPDIDRVVAAVLPADFTQADADNGFVLDRRGLIFNPEGGGLFNNTQDILAVYGLFNFDFDIGPIGVRGNVGARYVDTRRTSDTKTATQALDANGEFVRDAMQARFRPTTWALSALPSRLIQNSIISCRRQT